MLFLSVPFTFNKSVTKNLLANSFIRITFSVPLEGTERQVLIQSKELI